MLVQNHQQLYHTFLETYNNQEQNQIKRKSIKNFNTHILSLIAFRNELHCRKKSIDICITYFSSLIVIGEKFLCICIIISSFITHFFIFIRVRNFSPFYRKTLSRISCVFFNFNFRNFFVLK